MKDEAKKVKGPLRFRTLLTVLTLLDELVGNVEVTVKVEACGFVMQVGTRPAFIEEFKGFNRLNVKSLCQLYRNGTDAVAQYDFLNNR
jgi:hypothetical protein